MPLSTLQETPRDVPSKPRGQDGFATSFPVGLLHRLQHAGLSRRSPDRRRSGLVVYEPRPCSKLELRPIRCAALKRDCLGKLHSHQRFFHTELPSTDISDLPLPGLISSEWESYDQRSKSPRVCESARLATSWLWEASTEMRQVIGTGR